MTDRELLELAAQAAGRLLPHGNPALTRPNEELHHDGGNYWFWPAGDSWNPLEDDGDALRLAVTLNMGVSIPVWKDNRIDVITFRDSMVNVIEKGNDAMAATRRAIVRAAAAIGKTL